MEAPRVLPHEVKNPNEVRHFTLDGRRLYLLKRGDLDDRRDSIFRTIVSLSELAESWQQMADSSCWGSARPGGGGGREAAGGQGAGPARGEEPGGHRPNNQAR